MCGIVGFTTPLGDHRSGIVNSMMDSIEHRGPDDRNFSLLNSVTLGHVRLSIIDIQHGKQPMHSADKRYSLVFNGEIYNYLELRQQLVSRGHQFESFSDTEVLIHMYLEFGKEMLQHLNGMFAFVIYDNLEGTMFIARDHFGIKPFYYYSNDHLFAFASEIKALLKHPEINAEVNNDSLNEYLTFQLVMGEPTLFKNIQKLEPATYMIVKDNKIVEQETYWAPDYTINEKYSAEEFADQLLVLLENTLSLQTRSDVPIGAYLSGGLDSSIVATLASKNYFGDFKTFTGGFKEGAAYDETRYARIVSDSLKSDHHELFPTSTDFINTFEKLVHHMDEPAAGPGLFSQYMVSKMASEHVKVVLGGQGGDEVFGGYARYAVAYLEQCLKGSIFETQEEGQHVVTLASITENLPQLKQYAPMIKRQFADGLFDTMDKRYYRLVDRSSNLHKMYTDGFLSQRNDEAISDKFCNLFNQPNTSSYFNKMTNFDLKTMLPALLHVEDRVSMAVSLESRVPLLDKRIIELAASMPPTMKFAGGKTKYMLLKSVRNILPKEIIQRKDKMGFPTPFNEWMNGPLKEYALDTFNSQKSQQRGIFNHAQIEKQILTAGKYSRELWGALNLEVWHQKFID